MAIFITNLACDLLPYDECLHEHHKLLIIPLFLTQREILARNIGIWNVILEIRECKCTEGGDCTTLFYFSDTVGDKLCFIPSTPHTATAQRMKAEVIPLKLFQK